MKQPFFQFSFSTYSNDNKPITFTDPIEVYQTMDVQQVLPVLEKVQQAINNGYYAAGFLSYEAAPAFDANYKVVQDKTNFPLIYFAIFEEPTSVISYSTSGTYEISDWSFIANYKKYADGLQAIKQAIEKGDTYQVNYTTQLCSNFFGDGYAFYHQLRQNQQSSYNAYIAFEDYQLLSASPELFFQVNDGKITTKPMKGTAARGRTYQEDRQSKRELYYSEKERAENLMIVDLLRNDLGKVAELGTVHVSKQLEIETYPTVHQMTSTVTANLKEDTSIVEWFQALFPCGSITGAPKIKTMEYIASLEQTTRGVYCGAIGYITPKQEAIFNVPIRTVVVNESEQRATYGVGSGITWDSKVNAEFDELKVKAKLLTEKRQAFQLIETLLLEDGHYPLKTYHINRMEQSALYFSIPFSIKKINFLLTETKYQVKRGKHKIRLLLAENGEMQITNERLNTPFTPVTCTLSKEPIEKTNIFLYHKTTNRAIYQKHLSSDPTIFSTLLWNEQAEITEFTFGNVVVEIDSCLYTPPKTSGLLPGTYRAYLIDQGIIQERIITKKEVIKAAKVWFVNSLRGWIEVKLR